MMKKRNDNQDLILVGLSDEVAKLTLLKQKYTELMEEEETLWDNLEKRVTHLASVEFKTASCQSNSSSVNLNRYFALKLDRTILDYLLRQGYFTTAKLFARQKDIVEFSDLPVFVEIRKIKAALE